MPRGKMSAAARKRISEAARRYWADYRKAKAQGKVPAGTRRVGRPPKTSTGTNPFLNMTVAALAEAKKQLDQAWRQAKAALR